jgi:hypothetical protein
MYAQLIEAHAQVLLEERGREAEHQRLVDVALGPRRPIRSRIADGLLTIAAWIDESSSSRGRIAQAADNA